jgi:8-oxo-dGTP pyrophosphatase MutT (NUDIX family)
MHKSILLHHLNQYQPESPQDLRVQTAVLEFANAHDRSWSRSLSVGHLTASAWVVDIRRRRVLMTYHRKLQKWLQLGGHIDEGDECLAEAALREVREESGLSDVTLFCENPFDMDIHEIPATLREPAHLHYDIRYIVAADSAHDLICSDESDDLRWIDEEQTPAYSRELSIVRMLGKATKLLSSDVDKKQTTTPHIS